MRAGVRAAAAVDDEFYAVTHRAADARAGRVKRAFISDVRALASDVHTGRLEEAIRDRDTARVVAELAPRAGFLDQIGDALRETFAAAGEGTTEETLDQLRARSASLRVGDTGAPGEKGNIVLSFDMTNPRAAALAREIAAKLVTEITESMRDAIAERVAAAFLSGVDPRTLARQLIDEGLGLDGRRLDAVANFRARLEEEGIDEGKIDRRVARYYEAQLRSRAETIAHTESMAAASAGQLEAWRQFADGGLIEGTTKRGWLVTPDDALDIIICERMSDVEVALTEPWTLPDGRKVMIPNQSHPNCRCASSLILD